MTQPSQYRLGVIAFVGTCLLVYALIADFHQDLLPIVAALNPELARIIEKSMKDGSLSYPLVVIFSAAIFVCLLKIEQDWNPIFVLRRVVHGWVSIPQIANALMVMMRDELVVPVDARANVAGDLDTPYVTVGDFDKDRRSLDRHWAELCYIRLWLERHRAQGSHFTFFNEPSFAWDQLQTDYDNARARIAPLKRGDVTDTNIFADVAGKVELVAPPVLPARRMFFLSSRTRRRRDALRDAKQFGVTITPDAPRANPLRYSAIFAVAIIAAIYFGVSLSAITWDLLHHNRATPESSEIATRWMYYALANYGMPIMAVLLLRYLGWKSDRSQPNSYLISYATIFLVALCVAAACLTVAQDGRPAAVPMEGFGQQLYKNIKWGVSPAVVSIYIAYHVDRQIDPLLPDIGSFEHRRFPQRLMSCVFFANTCHRIFGAADALNLGLAIGVAGSQAANSDHRNHLHHWRLIMALVGRVLTHYADASIRRIRKHRHTPPRQDRASETQTLGSCRRDHGRSPDWVGNLDVPPRGHHAPMGIRQKASVLRRPDFRYDWTYELPASLGSVHFEVESRAAGQFRLKEHLHRRQPLLRWSYQCDERMGGCAPSRIAKRKLQSANGARPSRSRNMTTCMNASKAEGKSTFSFPIHRTRTSSNGAIRDLTSI